MTHEWLPIKRQEMNDLEGHPEFQAARDLLTKDLILKTATGIKHLRITQVEPFEGLIAENHLAAFRGKTRKAGELFIVWHRGIVPFLNVVVDPENGTIVCIKKAILDDEEITAARIIAELGLSRKNFAAGIAGGKTYKDTVDAALDGCQITEKNPRSLVSVEDFKKPDSAVIELRRHFGDRARNSLGLFGNCSLIPTAKI